MSTEFFCKICDIPCTGKAPYEQHLNSTKHLRKAKLLGSQTSSEQSISTNTNPSSPTINTPSLSTTANNNIFQETSILSSSILISPETMRILLEWDHPLGYKPYCDICQLPLHGGDNASTHFKENNNLHHQKLIGWKQIRERSVKYSCKVCSEVFLNENIMREHFDSDYHAQTIQQRDYLEKFIQIYETYQKLKQLRKQTKEKNSIEAITNQFQTLNVIDASKPKTDPLKSFAISPDKFAEALRYKFDDDDD